MYEYLVTKLESQGLKGNIAEYLSYAILAIGIILACLLVKIVIKIVSNIINRNKYKWIRMLMERKFFHKLANVLPGIIICMFASVFPESVSELIRRSASIYIMIIALFIMNSMLDAIDDIYRTHPISKVRPIKGLLQIVKIVIFIIVAIIIIADLMGQSPLILLSGIGAAAAVFSFVFKDSILGFIAGIQLTSNDMLRIGDWIEMPKYDADGDVIDITLNTVKVQNFDKTIVSIPAYALVSDSFKNWRGMMEFGGRRIKRAIYIDVNSITFCTDEILEKFKKIEYLKDYIYDKEMEIKEYNQKYHDREGSLINGRHMTNIGTFRIYIEKYLQHNPHLNKNVTVMVRQLSPGEHGLPIEIYAFTNSTDWGVYEKVQADIFDHIFSVAEEFGLRFFQNPTGYDVKQIHTYQE